MHTLIHTQSQAHRGVVMHICNPSCLGGSSRRFLRPGKVSETLSEKQNTNKRAGDMAQAEEQAWVRSPVPQKAKTKPLKPQFFFFFCGTGT
jgi:hypothetical protein